MKVELIVLFLIKWPLRYLIRKANRSFIIQEKYKNNAVWVVLTISFWVLNLFCSSPISLSTWSFFYFFVDCLKKKLSFLPARFGIRNKSIWKELNKCKCNLQEILKYKIQLTFFFVLCLFFFPLLQHWTNSTLTFT